MSDCCPGLTIDSGHDEANLGCVCGTGEVSVDLLGLVLIQRDETVEDVVASSGIVRATFIYVRPVRL